MKSYKRFVLPSLKILPWNLEKPDWLKSTIPWNNGNCDGLAFFFWSVKNDLDSAFIFDVSNVSHLSFQIPAYRTGKKIAIVGSGPSGLAAAAQLNRVWNIFITFYTGLQITVQQTHHGPLFCYQPQPIKELSASIIFVVTTKPDIIRKVRLFAVSQNSDVFRLHCRPVTGWQCMRETTGVEVCWCMAFHRWN